MKTPRKPITTILAFDYTSFVAAFFSILSIFILNIALMAIPIRARLLIAMVTNIAVIQFAKLSAYWPKMLLEMKGQLTSSILPIQYGVGLLFLVIAVVFLFFSTKEQKTHLTKG